MAFFGDIQGLCRDRWPGGLGCALTPNERSDRLESWRRLPVSFDELCDRVVVEGRARNNNRVLMAHPELDTTATGLAFTVRLQGVVADLNLQPLGTWNGDELNAPKATQSLTLVSGGCDAAFGPQRQGVMNLEELLMNMMGQPCMNMSGKKGAIKLTRRVFKKVSPDNAEEGVPLGACEDPGGRAAKMKHMWQVDHKVRTGIRTDTNGILPISPMAIRRGDFVDVAATVEVVTMRGKKGWRTEVQLCPVEVVRLHTAALVSSILTPKLAEKKRPEIAPPGRPVQVTGFVFESARTGQRLGDEPIPDDTARQEERMEVIHG